ncbi:hypothetical protein HNQ74_001389 [Bartonella doshiae]|uniref:Uncharacterized protein n=2 Tax=Bartonella doshiae TaxID=33044 RepID=A0A380ZEX6_BARDO|nr:hypothetical protein MCS_00293 [Bartonella doshiae NCTC 12862 = ATCC 700133]MBB6159947.1 hypothetical protein [Bartonella doshiae]SUV44705.1 Uncharacterised protein [Bartonella doshiae]
MSALSLACDDQQSPILTILLEWRGCFLNPLSHSVLNCFGSGGININKLMSFLIVNKPIEGGGNEENLKTVELHSSVKYSWM